MDTLALIVPSSAFASLIALIVLAVLLLVLLGLLTKNLRLTAIVAAVVLGAMILVYLIKPSLYAGLFYDIVSGMSLFGRFTTFSYGIFDVATVVYDLSFIAFFMYLTYQVLEKKRWS